MPNYYYNTNNKEVHAYRLTKKGYFNYLGYALIKHQNARGKEAAVYTVLHEKYGYKWDKDDEYTLFRKDIKLIQIPTGQMPVTQTNIGEQHDNRH